MNELLNSKKFWVGVAATLLGIAGILLVELDGPREQGGLAARARGAAAVRVKLVLPALTEAKSPFFRHIKYSPFPPLGLATLAGHLDPKDDVSLEDEHVLDLDTDDSPDLVGIEVYVTSARRAYGLAYQPSEITASCGAKHTLFNLFMALVEEGDEVVIPAPYWVSYPEQVQVAGGRPLIANAPETDGFLLRPEALAAALTPRTKAVVLNSPSNPTGAMYRREHLEALAEVLRGHDAGVVSDDIYHKLTYDGARFVSLLEVAPDLRDRVVIVKGVSVRALSFTETVTKGPRMNVTMTSTVSPFSDSSIEASALAS